MRVNFRELIFIIISYSPLFGALIMYNQLPEIMAVHFNSKNEVDGTMSRLGVIITITVMGLIPLLLKYLMKFTSKFDPQAIEPKSTTLFHAIRFIMVLLVATSGWSLILFNLGYKMDSKKIAFVLLATLFIIIGNYLPAVRPNFTIGIRTPWTMADDEIWIKTHRLAGPLLMLGGIMMLLALFLGKINSIFVLVLVMSLISFIPVIYSFLLYNRKNV
jgi:uncharacterized membrane protein